MARIPGLPFAPTKCAGLAYHHGVGIEVDARRRPVIDVRFEAPYGDIEFKDYIFRFESALRATEDARYVAILDASGSMPPTLGQLRLQANWIKANREFLDANCIGNAFVITRPLIREAFNTIQQLTNIPGENRAFATLSDAEAWSRELVHARIKDAIPENWALDR